MNFCTQPFLRVEIFEDGSVYNCCPTFLNYYSIGNIYEKSFEQVWNSEKAIELRSRILKGDFSLCSNNCNKKNAVNSDVKENIYKPVMEKYPKEINISTDVICNVSCKICRDELMKGPLSDKVFEEEILKPMLPMFKDAEILTFGCSGEPFANYKDKILIKEIINLYPNIKFHFHTNGILGNKQLLDELSVYDKISTMTVSMHSSSEETYKKIVKGGNYNKVINNLRLYSEMKKNGLINKLRMIFVVYSENYHEMPAFVELASKYNATCEFWGLRKNSTELGANYDEYSIIEPNHKEYINLVNVLKSDIFDSDFVTLYPEIKRIRDNIGK